MDSKTWGSPLIAALIGSAVSLGIASSWLRPRDGAADGLAELQGALSRQSQVLEAFEQRLSRLESAPGTPEVSGESHSPATAAQQEGLTFQQELELMEKLQRSKTPEQREKMARGILASERSAAKIAALRALIEDDPERGIAAAQAFVAELKPDEIGAWGLAEAAILALSQARGAAVETVLYGYFESSEPMVRIPAARALDQRGDPRALDRLIAEFSQGLASADAVVRKRGVTDLGRTKSPRAVKPLEHLTSDPSADVRLELARMLYFLRDSSSLQLSRKLMDDPSPAVRDEARKANEMLREFQG